MTDLPTHAPTAATIGPEKQSTWPTVIGIIAITFGSVALLQNGLCAPAGLLMSGVFGSMMEDMSQATPQAGMDVQVAQLEAIREYLPHQLVMALGSALVAAILLVGGIRLVRRRAKAQGTITLWAVAKMVIALPGAWLGYVTSQAQFAAMADAAKDSAGSPGQMPAGFFGVLESFGGAMSAVTLVWMWVLPLFMLIWFARKPIQDEVALWEGT